MESLTARPNARVSATENSDRTTAIAGKPAPTGMFGGAEVWATPSIKCGSLTARSNVRVSATENSDWTTAIAGKPTPTGMFGGAEVWATPSIK
ncbi:hypothetical protein, partial [Pseudomonas shahriarae]|uniref:hypothetical protein n=1 Tax=Pseudomonas shahriarae TaxID=2745512 RepID=UPI00249B40ED